MWSKIVLMFFLFFICLLFIQYHTLMVYVKQWHCIVFDYFCSTQYFFYKYVLDWLSELALISSQMLSSVPESLYLPYVAGETIVSSTAEKKLQK